MGDGPTAEPEQLGKEVIRTQWLDHSTLGNHPLVNSMTCQSTLQRLRKSSYQVGRKILIVDEVDDSRTTLDYTVKELQKDVEDQLAKMSAEKRAKTPTTEFAIFVGKLPLDI